MHSFQVLTPAPTTSAEGANTSDALPSITGEVPLVVDVDGTLLRSDLLWEGLLQLFFKHPARILALPGAVFRGRAALKACVATESHLSTDDLPLEQSTLKLIRQAQAQGQVVVLASGAYEGQVREIGSSLGVGIAWGSDTIVSLTGSAKLKRILAHCSAFDYAGNDAADLPVWEKARRAYAVNAHARVLRRAQRVRPDLIVLQKASSFWRPWIRALRPHQWAKNGLLVLPALAAHLPFTAGLTLQLLAGFLAFSALASSVYLVNDLVDLAHDRAHPSKRHRPLARGDISIPVAIGTVAFLLATTTATAWILPPTFSLILTAYLAITTAYSLALKRRAILDVITLATLYTIRVIAGAALVDVPMSRWFLAFSIFFFFSLALVKRVVELHHQPPTGEKQLVAGRGYSAMDLQVLTAIGTSAVCVSSLVYCLYITSGDVMRLYGAPDLLWLGLPILLYWQARIWLLTGRGVMNEDPVVFALRDRISHLLFGLLLVTLWLAT